MSHNQGLNVIFILGIQSATQYILYLLSTSYFLPVEMFCPTKAGHTGIGIHTNMYTKILFGAFNDIMDVVICIFKML